MHFWKLSTDYPEEPHPYWEHSHCCCKEHHHSPQTEAERTEGDGADLLENLPADVTGGDVVEEAEDLSERAARESDLTAASRDDIGLESDLGKTEEEDMHEHRKQLGQIDLGVPEEELVGVLKELELTLRMTSVLEQEKIKDLAQPVDSETACSLVRRRNKRRRAKKDTNWPTRFRYSQLEPGSGLGGRMGFLVCSHQIGSNMKAGDSMTVSPALLNFKWIHEKRCEQGIFYISNISLIQWLKGL